jgi:predicted amidohydrolase YtcJ
MDVAFVGGAVLTMDRANPQAEALRVREGRIAAVGRSAELSTRIGPDTRVVHLAGRTVTPGFIDPHTHFHMTTFEPVSVDCRTPPHESVVTVLAAVAAAAAAAPRGQWITGFGFRTRFVREQRAMTRGELDEVAPAHPVCIVDGSVHGCYANSVALALAGIDRRTPDPPHGAIGRDPAGEPNGTLWERALDLVFTPSLRASLERFGDNVTELVAANGRRHLACGITSVADAVVTPEVAELYRRVDARKKLPLCLHQMRGGQTFFAPPVGAARGSVDAAHVSDRLRGGTVKLFMDPVFPTSALIRYHPGGREERIGERYYSQDEANELVLAAHRHGLQVAIHCIGTWALEQALDAFAYALRAHPRDDPRFRVEHFALPTLAQIRRARELGVIATVQPGFIWSGPGQRWAGIAAQMGGDVRPIPLRTMLAEGLEVAASSDYPCGPLEPLLGLYAMVTRHTRTEGLPLDPEEAVTPLEGLRMYTLGAARAMGRDHEVGSLEPGKRADLVVLSHDPTAVDPAALREVVVEQTWVDGELVYAR